MDEIKIKVLYSDHRGVTLEITGPFGGVSYHTLDKGQTLHLPTTHTLLER